MILPSFPRVLPFVFRFVLKFLQQPQQHNNNNKKNNNESTHKTHSQLKMTVKNIENLEEFKGAIGGDKLVVVDFTATW